MNYINIIAKEPVLAIPDWIVYTISGVCMSIILICMIYSIRKNTDLGLLSKIGICVVIFDLVALCACSMFFKVPTGKYKYEVTVNKDEITVSEYEEFIEKYNPTFQDGIYYWED